MDQSEFFCLHSDLCKTLANAKRQMILNALREGESTVTEIQERTSIPQATLSQHLAILRSSGVVRTRREGNRVFYAITNSKIIQAFDLITEVMKDIIGDRKDVAEGVNEG
ncbi:MAG: ArsR/SmtB family transcription factor [Coriobacteriia bacterium]